jgi:hypothetical protein
MGFIMPKAFAVIAFLIALKWLPQSILGQDRTVIENCKASVALVEVGSDKNATAFCIDPNGVFVTNHHVVEDIEQDGEVRLVMQSSEADEWSLSASVHAVDEKNDLAILKAHHIPEGKKLTALKLSRSPNLYETMNLIAFGFPFGKQLTVTKGSNPSISVNVGKLTAIRKESGAVELIQLDATLNPGNSGGPVTDESGNVIGVVSFGLLASGVNFAIPVEKVWPLVKIPLIDVEAQGLGVNPEAPVDIGVRLVTMQSTLKDPSVELWVKMGESPEKRIELKSSDEIQYRAKVIVAEEDPTKLSLRARAVFEQGEASFQMTNKQLKLDEKEQWLSWVSSMRLLDDQEVLSCLMRDGSEIKVERAKLPSIEVNYGDIPATLPLSKVQYFEVIRQNPGKLTARLEVKSEGKTLFIHPLDTQVTVDVQATPADLKEPDGPGPFDSLKKAIEVIGPKERVTTVKENKVINIPGQITDVARAGAGRYLLVSVASSEKLIIIDVDNGVVAKILKLPSSATRVCGTKQHFFVLDLPKRVVARFSLESFEPDLAAPLPFEGTLRTMVSGEASNGPLLICSLETQKSSKVARWDFLDIERLKVIPVKLPGDRQIPEDFVQGVQVRASADGRVFGIWNLNSSPMGLRVATLVDRNLTLRSKHATVGHIVPTADGKALLTATDGILDPTFDPLGTQLSPQAPLFLTSHPEIYLSYPKNESVSYTTKKQQRVLVHQIGAKHPLARLPLSSEDIPVPNFFEQKGEITFDKRLFLDVESGLLVSIPSSNDRIHIQPFDLGAEIARISSDYFLAYSPKIDMYSPGQTYTSHVRVETNRKELSYELYVGPPGLTVESDGKITWNVPNGYKPRTADVIVAVSSDGVHQGFSAFTLKSTRGK